MQFLAFTCAEWHVHHIFFKKLKKSNFSIVNFALLFYCKGIIRYILFPMRLPYLHTLQISYDDFYCITFHKSTHKLLAHSWVSSWIQMTPFPIWYTTKYYVRRIDSLGKDSCMHAHFSIICSCIYVCLLLLLLCISCISFNPYLFIGLLVACYWVLIRYIQFAILMNLWINNVR